MSVFARTRSESFLKPGAFLGGLTAACSLEASTPGANGAFSTGAAGRKISVRINLWQAFLKVNNERTVRCILTGGVSVLLDRFDGVLLQNFIPGRTSG